MPRLCAETGSLDWLEDSWLRGAVLDAERDRLRARTAASLLKAGYRDSAHDLAQQVRDRLARFCMLLRTINRYWHKLLESAALYATVAGPGPLEGEILALEALTEPSSVDEGEALETGIKSVACVSVVVLTSELKRLSGREF